MAAPSHFLSTATGSAPTPLSARAKCSTTSPSTSWAECLLQEDVGNQVHLGKIWIYDIASGAVLEVARHDPNVFLSTGANYIGTQDEEASGIIDVSSILGPGTYLFDDQVHKAAAAPDTLGLVEGGQLLVMRIRATAGIGFDSATNGPALVVLGTDKDNHIEVEQSGLESRGRDRQARVHVHRRHRAHLCRGL